MGKNLYTERFYDYQRSTSALSAQKIFPLIKEYLVFDSVVDVGCGVGEWLKVCQEMGSSRILGIDGVYVNQEQLAVPKHCFHPSDISLPLNLVEKPFDLVISVEVAEHIECSKVDTYLENLVHLGEVILFSAAIPWQGGLHHVNEQWPSYWVERFALKGYIPVDCLREKIWSDEDICPHYRQNLMFFIKETSIERYNALKNEIAMGKSRVLDLVHPEYYKRLNDVKKMSFKWTLSQFLKFLSALFPTFLRAVRKRI